MWLDWHSPPLLWVGAVSDSEYMERSRVLDLHEKYETEFDTEYSKKPFTLILDKGYRINEVSWKKGFSRSETRFLACESIRSSAIASYQSCNERAVRLSKINGYIRTGLKQNKSTKRLDDVWL
jgi:hypothetical protein